MKYNLLTLWHKRSDGSYKRILFDKVLIFEKKGLNINGSVMDEENYLEARIFSVSRKDISAGDMVCVGHSSSLTPTKNAYIVKKIQENLSTNANLRHYRIIGV